MASVVLLPFSLARATDYVWDGQVDDLWDGVSGGFFTNWTLNGALMPGSADTVTFGGGPSTLMTTINLNGGRTVLSATFADFSFSQPANFQLNANISTDSLTLVDGNITATGTGTHRLSADVDLGSSGTWSIDNPLFQVDRLLTSAGRLTKTGTGTLELRGGSALEPSSLLELVSDEGTVLIDGGHMNLTSTSIFAVRVSGGGGTHASERR